MTKQNYDGIDILKFVASIMVLMIHTKPFKDVNVSLENFISQGVTRVAVPIFFIISAYFLYKKLASDKQRQAEKQNTINYCKRILRLYFSWFVISLPIIYCDRFLLSGYSFPVTLFRFVRGALFSSTFGGSWFLTSCIFCSILFYYLNNIDKKNQNSIVIVISTISYLLCVLSSSYRGLFSSDEFDAFYKAYEMLFCNPYTSILVGIPYFAIGKYFATKNSTMSRGKILFLIVLFGVTLLFELYFTNSMHILKSHDCYFSLLPCALCIFLFSLRSNIHIKYAKKLRNASTVIFFSQFIWIFIFQVLHTLNILSFKSYYLSIIVLLLCIATYYIIARLSKKYPILKRLY